MRRSPPAPLFFSLFTRSHSLWPPRAPWGANSTMEGQWFAGGRRAASQDTAWGFAEASGAWGAQGLPKRKSLMTLSGRGSLDATPLGDLAIGDGLRAAKKR